MSGRAWLNVGAIMDAVRAAEEEAIDETADHVAAEARRRAPVRKVFREAGGYRPKLRALTEPEKSLAIRRAIHFYTAVRPDEFARRRAVAHIQSYARVAIPRRGSANAISRTRTLRTLGVERAGRFTARAGATRLRTGGYTPGEIAPLLTSRGRYEITTGRAIHLALTKTGAKVMVGGALKASIGNEGVVQSGDGMTARVTAAIRYAKYVEFPTIRTRAQPFLLPALHGEREKFRQRLAAKIKASLGG